MSPSSFVLSFLYAILFLPGCGEQRGVTGDGSTGGARPIGLHGGGMLQDRTEVALHGRRLGLHGGGFAQPAVGFPLALVAQTIVKKNALDDFFFFCTMFDVCHA